MVDEKAESDEMEARGFAGLSSLVTDVDTMSANFAGSTIHSTNSENRRSFTLDEQLLGAQTSRSKGSTLLASDKWLIGIIVVVVVGVLFLFISKIDKKAAIYQPVQTAATSHFSPINSTASVIQPAPVAPPKIHAYVISAKANLRAAPNLQAKIVGTVDEMSQIEVLQESGLWTRVKVSGATPVEGFIASRLLHVGSYVSAKRILCDIGGSTRPHSGEVLLKARSGGHRITVNAGNRDTLVKLRNHGKTILAFYVRAHEKGVVSSVPNGTYEVMFATGKDFSRKCLEFVEEMSVIKDPNPVAFQITSDGNYEYSSTAEYSLVYQHNGNMRPQTVDADYFRE